MFNALMREAVCETDPLAGVLTISYSECATAKMIKFYESDQQGAPEILQDLRSILDQAGFLSILQEVIQYCQIHGWCIVYPYINPQPDEEGNAIGFSLECEVYSEYECPSNQIKRDINNRITGYEIHKVPKLPMLRNKGNLHSVDRIFQSEQVMHVTLGKFNYGFGTAALMGIWDPLSKLREMSHSDHFRSKVVPFVKVPQDWDDTDIDSFMDALAKTDTMNALVMRATEDNQGNPVADLPAVSLDTMATDAKGKSSQGGTAGISDLASEWARLCGRTRRSVGYFTGAGAISASMAAGGVDSNDDTLYDIIDFNKYNRTFIIPFVQWFAEQLGIPIQPFVVKSWWEWTKDELAMQQMEMQQQEQDMQMKQIESTSQNIAPGQFVPIASSSGLQGIMLERAPNRADKLHVKFQEPYGWYSIQDPAVIGRDASAMGDQIVAGGGSEYYRQIRRGGPPAPDGQSPVGTPKVSFANNPYQQVPYAGKAHAADYQSEMPPEEFREGLSAQQALAGGVLGGHDDFSEYGDALTADIENPQEPQGFSPEESTEILQRMEDVNRPRVGRPRKTTQIKGGDERYAIPGQRGRASFTDYWDAKGSVYHAPEGMSAPGRTESFSSYADGVYMDVKRPAAAPQSVPPSRPAAKATAPRAQPSTIGRILRGTTKVLKKVAKVGRMLTRNEKEELTEKDYTHPYLREYGSINQAAKELHLGKQTIYNEFDGIEVSSFNSLILGGNSFSTKNPFKYNQDGLQTVEYQCPESIKKLIGTRTPIIYNHTNADPTTLEPISEDVVLGHYTINGFDEETGSEIAEYDFDEEKLTKNGLDWLLKSIREGKLPDTSTGYFNKLKFDRTLNRLVQTDFRLKHLAIVSEGNCSKPSCTLRLKTD